MPGFDDNHSGDQAVSFWSAPDLGAELLHGRFRRFSYAPHVHETACLALITRGQIRIRMRGQEFTARAGDLYAIDADEAHAGWSVDAAGWQQRTMYIDTTRLRSLLVAGGGPVSGTLRGPIIRDATLVRLFLGIHRCSQTGGSRLKRQSHYLDFTERLLARYVTPAPSTIPPLREPKAVRLAMNYLDAEVASRVSLDDVSRVSNLPPFHILRAFERHTGLTPHAYQRVRRLESAQTLIRKGLDLAAVAATAGFADQAHLTRAFKSAFGIPPGAYRRAVR